LHDGYALAPRSLHRPGRSARFLPPDGEPPRYCRQCTAVKARIAAAAGQLPSTTEMEGGVSRSTFGYTRIATGQLATANDSVEKRTRPWTVGGTV